MTGRPKRVGERVDAGREALGVMEQEHLGHARLLAVGIRERVDVVAVASVRAHPVRDRHVRPVADRAVARP